MAGNRGRQKRRRSRSCLPLLILAACASWLPWHVHGAAPGADKYCDYYRARDIVACFQGATGCTVSRQDRQERAAGQREAGHKGPLPLYQPLPR